MHTEKKFKLSETLKESEWDIKGFAKGLRSKLLLTMSCDTTRFIILSARMDKNS